MRFAEPFSSTSYGVDKMPVLQMLGVEAPSITPSTEPNFQLLLKVQQLKKPMTISHFLESDSRIPPVELESCVTHVSETHFPAKSETKDHPNPHWSPCPEVVSSVRNLEPNSPEIYKRTSSSPIQIPNQTDPQFAKPSSAREKKKRKRTRPLKNSEEVESQRMTHIAVERNRRKQMNDHLAALRSLMPSSFVHRVGQPRKYQPFSFILSINSYENFLCFFVLGRSSFYSGRRHRLCERARTVPAIATSSKANAKISRRKLQTRGFYCHFQWLLHLAPIHSLLLSGTPSQLHF